MRTSVLGVCMLSLGIVAAASAGGCGEKKGALMLAINTDMKAPKDVNAVSVTISTNGAIKHSFLGRVTPEGDVLLPATVAIVEPEEKSQSIRIRVMAFQGRAPRVLRDVRTTVPTGGRIALLRVALNFASDRSAVGPSLPEDLLPAAGPPSPNAAAQFDFFGTFQPPCPDIENQTVIDGECTDNFVQPDALPDFDSAAVGQGDDASSCFDVPKCFATRSFPLTLDRSSCTLGVDGFDVARANIAIVTTGTGECLREGECYVPLDRGPSGWREENGRIRLPSFVCKLLDDTRLRLALSTAACDAKGEANPICVAPRVDAGRDASTTTTGDCVTLGEIQTRPCGTCGMQRSTCEATADRKTWSPFGACENEVPEGCAPGVPLTNQACGNCGTQTVTCTATCQRALGACTGEPTNSCAPGAVEQSAAGCPADTFRRRTCLPSCMFGAYGACAP